MTRLKNPQHEELAKRLAEGVKKPEAYEEVYDCAKSTALSEVYRLIKEKPEIADRQSELMDLQGLDQVYINSKLKDIIDKPDNQAVQHEVCKTVLKMHGVLDQKAPLIDARQVHITDNSTNTENVLVDEGAMKTLVGRLGKLNKSLSFDHVDAQDGEIINDGENSTEPLQREGLHKPKETK